MKSLSLLSLLALLITFSNSSCKKEDKEETCRVTKAEAFQSGNVAATANYTYTSNRVTKVDLGSFGSYSLDYNGDRIVKRRFFPPNSTTLDAYEDITYNADGTISKVEAYEQLSATAAEKYAITTFTYTGGKLSRMQYSVLTTSNTFELIEEHVYTYTGNNITSVTSTDYSGSQPMTTTATYQYDAENNYFKRQSTQFILTDPFFSSLEGTLLPFVFSANNPTSVRNGSGPSVPIEYTKDNRGNVTAFTAAGQKLYGYTYQCD